ncbi:MAG TPA: hypothetical protein VLT62_08735 [Candidatus Methylomirabilis sp.]|nr:hypothetical protein [Candidatus Methylomirabilis sp.]
MTGTVPSGAPLETATLGTHAFAVSATDAAGNSTATTRAYTVVYPGNITPTSPSPALAWGENAGWLNFKPAYGEGVTVSASAVTGRVWSENVGWIALSPATGGVLKDGAGHLSGFAWGENVGWIHFAPPGGGVTIHGTSGTFSGLARGENIGWIDLAPTGWGVTTTFPDSMPPTIAHTPMTSRAVNTPIPISATITDTASVQGAILFYRPTGGDQLRLPGDDAVGRHVQRHHSRERRHASRSPVLPGGPGHRQQPLARAQHRPGHALQCGGRDLGPHR